MLDDSRAEEVVGADGDGGDLTLALLEKALDLRLLLPLAALLAFAMARNYTLTFKKTKTTVSFSFGPGDGAVHANIGASIALPDFGKLETALQGLATAVGDLQPKTAQLEIQAAKVQQLAPATGASLQQDLTGFSDILGDVIEVVQLLAKVEILEEVFDFVDVASKLQSIQAQITSLQTQASDLDHEVTVVNTLLGQLNNPTQQLSTQLQSVAQQNTKSWQPTYSAVPGNFKLAEKANQSSPALQALGGAKVLLAAAPHNEAIESVLGGLAIDGQVLLAAFQDPIRVPSMALIPGRRAIQGWPSGTAIDSEDTLKFSAFTGTKPMVETYPLSKVNEAFERMITNQARFRVVLTMD